LSDHDRTELAITIHRNAQSESNTKPEYIMGHSLQAVSLLVHAAASVFAVPPAIRIHEGLVWSNRDRRTLLDKMLALLGIAAIAEPCYFVADAYYAARKIVIGLLKDNNHLLTRVKSNTVAYTAYQQRGPHKRGRPRVYGRKVKLNSLLADPKGREQARCPVYGERQIVIHYKVRDLLWRPAGRLVRFVAVIHPTRGSCLLMCTDTSLQAIEIIRLYGLRFKIEHTFKQARTQHSCHQVQSGGQICCVAQLQRFFDVLISPQPVGQCLADAAPGSLMFGGRQVAAGCPN